MNTISYNGCSYEVDSQCDDYVNVQVDIPYAGKRITESDICDLLADELLSGIWEVTLQDCGKFNRIVVKSTTARCASIIAESQEGVIVRRINCKGKSSLLRMSLSVTDI